MNSRNLIGIIGIAVILVLSGCIQGQNTENNENTAACDEGHELGETWTAEDKCNSCTCTENGAICTKKLCIKEGECIDETQCETQGLIHAECTGKWNCIEQQCVWECGTEQFNEEQNAGMANPASVKCAEDGGINKIKETPEGQQGLCVFEDNSYCDEWAYFRGECNKGEKLMLCVDNGNVWADYNTGEFLYHENCGPPQPHEPGQGG